MSASFPLLVYLVHLVPQSVLALLFTELDRADGTGAASLCGTGCGHPRWRACSTFRVYYRDQQRVALSPGGPAGPACVGHLPAATADQPTGAERTALLTYAVEDRGSTNPPACGPWLRAWPEALVLVPEEPHGTPWLICRYADRRQL